MQDWIARLKLLDDCSQIRRLYSCELLFKSINHRELGGKDYFTSKTIYPTRNIDEARRNLISFLLNAHGHRIAGLRVMSRFTNLWFMMHLRRCALRDAHNNIIRQCHSQRYYNWIKILLHMRHLKGISSKTFDDKETLSLRTQKTKYRIVSLTNRSNCCSSVSSGRLVLAGNVAANTIWRSGDRHFLCRKEFPRKYEIVKARS